MLTWPVMKLSGLSRRRGHKVGSRLLPGCTAWRTKVPSLERRQEPHWVSGGSTRLWERRLGPAPEETGRQVTPGESSAPPSRPA